MKSQPSIRKRLHQAPKSSWEIASKYIKAQERAYDAAIGFLEGTADFYAIDKVCADRKIGWIHSDFSGRKLPPDEEERYCRFDFLVTITEQCKQSFIQILPQTSKKLLVIENIVCVNDVRAAASLPMKDTWEQTQPQILTVGRLEYQKGIDIAAEASLILKKRGIAHNWHVIGAGSLESKLRSFILENHLEDAFVLDGQKSNPYPYMKRADIIVQSSRREGKSIVLDEAKILGKAIVTTNYPSVSDQITDGIDGLVVEMNPYAVADGVIKLLEDRKLIKQLEQNCLLCASSATSPVEKFYRII